MPAAPLYIHTELGCCGQGFGERVRLMRMIDVSAFFIIWLWVRFIVGVQESESLAVMGPPIPPFLGRKSVNNKDTLLFRV